MKKQFKLASCLLLAMSVSSLAACNSSNQNATTTEARPQDTGVVPAAKVTGADAENSDPAGVQQEDWKKEREEFRADVNKKIEKNKQDIAKLKAEAKNKKADARKDYDKMIADLEARNDKMKSRMNDYKDDSKDNWQSFKREFNHDMDELGTAIKDVFKDNKK